MGASESERLSFPPVSPAKSWNVNFRFSISRRRSFSVYLRRQNLTAMTSIQNIFNCDLLIIDDLGSEYTNAFIAAQFFTCINERLIHKKSTIISTNLSLESLANLYTERSFSRITSSYALLKIIGDDIRIKKKLKNREVH